MWSELITDSPSLSPSRLACLLPPPSCLLPPPSCLLPDSFYLLTVSFHLLPVSFHLLPDSYSPPSCPSLTPPPPSFQRMDMGECPRKHDLALRADFEAAQKLKDHFYDVSNATSCHVTSFFRWTPVTTSRPSSLTATVRRSRARRSWRTPRTPSVTR